MRDLDPSSAALFALTAVALVALGAVLTGTPDTGLSIAERGTVLGGIVAVLVGVYYLGHKHRPPPPGDE